MITGEQLRKIRKERGLTQEELATRAGNVSQAHIARIESGKTDPRLSVINSLVKALEVDANEVECKQIMTGDVIYSKPDESIKEASRKMLNFGFSQLPVIEKNPTGKTKNVGTLTERDVIQKVILGNNLSESPATSAMGPPMPIVGPQTRVSEIPALMNGAFQAVLVMKGDELLGIISRSDILRFVDRFEE